MTRDEALTLAVVRLANAVLRMDRDPETAKRLAEEAKDIAQNAGKP